jgi:hypothetical protein
MNFPILVGRVGFGSQTLLDLYEQFEVVRRPAGEVVPRFGQSCTQRRIDYKLR